MEYLPGPYRSTLLVVGDLQDLVSRVSVSATTVVRKAKFLDSQSTDRTGSARAGTVGLRFEGLATPVEVNIDREMTFGDETRSIAKYLLRVVETGDYLDLILDPRYSPLVAYLWIHIEYMDERPAGLSFSQKDDGLFAMRTKSGEKAERIAARQLSEAFHHTYPEDQLVGPGVLRIWYRGKKERRPDLTCSSCGFTVEVKKRNFDTWFRVSHSSARPFWRDNPENGWHAFVFPDFSIHWVPNRLISELIRSGSCSVVSDRYDTYAQLPSIRVREESPPACPAWLSQLGPAAAHGCCAAPQTMTEEVSNSF